MPGKILVIDDEVKYASMLKDLLDGHDFDAEMCTDPKEGLNIMNQTHFDLIVTDYKMPEMDGAEFLLKARESNPDVPVIIVSGLMNMPELIKVANMGVTLVLEKPFDTGDFLAQVERFVTPRSGDSVEAPPESVASSTQSDELDEGAKPAADEVQFPRPTACFSAGNAHSRAFLNAVYREREQVSHQFVSIPCFRELEYLGFELSQWSFGKQRAPRIIHFKELILNETHKSFLEYSDEPVVWIIVLGNDWDSGILDKEFRRWIGTIQEGKEPLSQCRFVYQVPATRVVECQAWLKNSDFESISEKVHCLPELSARPEDITGYLHQYMNHNLEQGNKMAWEEDAAKALLCAEWRENLLGLQGILGRIFSDPELEYTVTRQIVNRAIAWHPGEDVDAEASEEAYLQKRQTHFIQQNREKGERWQETARRLGAVPSRIDEEKPLAEQPLLVNEVLTHEARNQQFTA